MGLHTTVSTGRPFPKLFLCRKISWFKVMALIFEDRKQPKMSDIFSKEIRSKIMKAINSSGNKTTEIKFKIFLRKNKIRGWKSNQKLIFGSPDIVFPKKKIAIFIDGCFWHGCSICKRNLHPKTNSDFWEKKIRYNKKRSKKVNRILKDEGWKVLRFWEHSLQKNPETCLRKLNSLLD